MDPKTSERKQLQCDQADKETRSRDVKRTTDEEQGDKTFNRTEGRKALSQKKQRSKCRSLSLQGKTEIIESEEGGRSSTIEDVEGLPKTTREEVVFSRG